jgi:hypothetical protein
MLILSMTPQRLPIAGHSRLRQVAALFALATTTSSLSSPPFAASFTALASSSSLSSSSSSSSSSTPLYHSLSLFGVVPPHRSASSRTSSTNKYNKGLNRNDLSRSTTTTTTTTTALSSSTATNEDIAATTMTTTTTSTSSPSDNVLTPASKLEALRLRMKELDLDAYLIPPDDPHLSGTLFVYLFLCLLVVRLCSSWSLL